MIINSDLIEKIGIEHSVEIAEQIKSFVDTMSIPQRSKDKKINIQQVTMILNIEGEDEGIYITISY